jgi:hypothetical protein
MFSDVVEQNEDSLPDDTVQLLIPMMPIIEVTLHEIVTPFLSPPWPCHFTLRALFVARDWK